MRLRVRSAMLTILSMLALLISVIPRGAEAQQATLRASLMRSRKGRAA